MAMPNNVKDFTQATSTDITFSFENGLILNNLYNTYEINLGENRYRVIALRNGKYYVEFNNEILELSKDEINNMCKFAIYVENNPSLFLDFINDLKKNNLDINELYNGFLMINISIKNRQTILEKINQHKEEYLEILKKSGLLDNDDKFSVEMLKEDASLQTIDFIDAIRKYNIKDKYILNRIFINANNENLYKYYDANLKRLLIASNFEVDDSINDNVYNLADLLTLLSITGAFSEDPIVRQRVQTFLTERVFTEKYENGIKNMHAINGNDIHRIFNFKAKKEPFNKEFAKFFLENYCELIDAERDLSGFIEKVYKYFDEIKTTCTSNKGNQRSLKVTVEKCQKYLISHFFDDVKENEIKFAKTIHKFFIENEAWNIAKHVYNESLSAPRNIFTKTYKNEEGKLIFDNNSIHDLREKVNNNFSYEWLPKQDYDNLILGKYCSCCAHVLGAGFGIMRASMILDNCQNLVVRDNLGNIIAKSSIYVNREKGYAIFNTVEISLNHRDEESLNFITEAYLRGVNAFFRTYNENNPDNVLKFITVGANRNALLKALNEKDYPTVPPYAGINYSNYSESRGTYPGDWQNKQKVLIKK